MTGVLPDFRAVYDSCTGIYAVWTALLILGLPALAACLSAELSYALACVAVAPVSSPTLVPVESRTVETIGQGREGSQPVSLDTLRPTSIIPCVVRGVCRYRDARTGRFVRFDATELPV